MQPVRRVLLALGAVLLCRGAAGGALETLDACATQAPPRAHGIAELEAACPGLETALREQGVVKLLSEGWRDRLDRDGLRDLASLAHRYDKEPPQAAPDPAPVAAILQQLASEQAQPTRSWWDAVRQWLLAHLGRQDAGSDSWLSRLLERITPSQHVLKIIINVLLVLVVAAALAVLGNELRVAGGLARGRRRGMAAAGAGAAPPDAATPLTADLDGLAPRDQPAMLLRLLVVRLLASGQLRAERSLTHRELLAQSRFDDADNRTVFARVTQLAERMLYGAGDAGTAQAAAVIADGRRLLAQLQAAGERQP